MPRIARICAIDYPHHITQRGNNKETVFFEDKDRVFYLKTLSKYSHKQEFEILAYCLMVNHVHLLVVPKKEDSLARGIGSTNLVYTQYINRKYKRSGRLWQNRFFSTIVEKEPYLWAVARYIEQNPVRAGIVKNVEGYLWSSAKAHILGKNDDILSGKSWFEKSELETYQSFLKDDDKKVEALIRKATSTGRPLGNESFVKKLEKILGLNILPKKAGRPKKEE
ncbi:MAG: transposase [Candidatus Omnitrophica bacterium]|nr:transposase [Candidatus Omnitrophota bacterium]